MRSFTGLATTLCGALLAISPWAHGIHGLMQSGPAVLQKTVFQEFISRRALTDELDEPRYRTDPSADTEFKSSLGVIRTFTRTFSTESGNMGSPSAASDRGPMATTGVAGFQFAIGCMEDAPRVGFGSGIAFNSNNDVWELADRKAGGAL